MKTYIFITLLLLSFQSVFSQDNISLHTYLKLSKEKDSLQNYIVRPLQDSLVRIESKLVGVRAENQTLIKKNQSLEKQVESLSSKKLKFENNRLTNELNKLVESNTTLKSKLSVKTAELVSSEIDCDKKIVAERINAKNEIISIVAAPYKASFDEIVGISTVASIRRDKEILESKNDIILVLNEVLHYHECLNVLNNKYSNVETEKANALLNSITANSFLKEKLKKDIVNYKSYSEALIKMIEELKRLDTLKSAPELETKKLKFLDISMIINEYLYNYFEYHKYPYIVRFLNGLLDMKRQNPDASIEKYLDEMK